MYLTIYIVSENTTLVVNLQPTCWVDQLCMEFCVEICKSVIDLKEKSGWNYRKQFWKQFKMLCIRRLQNMKYWNHFSTKTIMWTFYATIGFIVSKYISNKYNVKKIYISEEEYKLFFDFGTGFFFSIQT